MIVPEVARLSVLLGLILKVPVPTDRADVLLARALSAASAETSSVGAKDMAPTTSAISVDRLILIAINLYLSLRPSISCY